MKASARRRSAIDRSVDPALIERFSSAFYRLTPGGHVGLAVSGGADSMAMLLLAIEALDEFEVATVDHGLRSESAEECAAVARLCSERGVICAVLKVEVGHGNLQDRARQARYAALGKWAGERDLSAILTAHHADDQSETLLMRLNRGSGLAGLAGIRERGRVEGCEVPVLRPLLGFRRSELARIADAAGILAAADPGNCDPRFERARMRMALADAAWIDSQAVARSAAHLAEAEEALSSIADTLWQDRVVESDDEIRLPRSGWAEIDARLLSQAIERFGGSASRHEVSQLIENLRESGNRRNLAGVIVQRDEHGLICRPEPPRRSG